VKAANGVDNHWVVDYSRFVDLVKDFNGIGAVGGL